MFSERMTLKEALDQWWWEFCWSLPNFSKESYKILEWDCTVVLPEVTTIIWEERGGEKFHFSKRFMSLVLAHLQKENKKVFDSYLVEIGGEG